MTYTFTLLRWCIAFYHTFFEYIIIISLLVQIVVRKVSVFYIDWFVKSYCIWEQWLMNINPNNTELTIIMISWVGKISAYQVQMVHVWIFREHIGHIAPRVFNTIMDTMLPPIVKHKKNYWPRINDKTPPNKPSSLTKTAIGGSRLKPRPRQAERL